MPKAKTPFQKPRNNTSNYERQLRKVAREVGRIIEGFHEKTLTSVARMQGVLSDYARILEPWARLKGAEMAKLAEKQDVSAWRRSAAELSAGMRQEIRKASTGNVLLEIMNRQVKYITSLPIEAGQRVHKLVVESMSNSGRAAQIAEEIARSGEVTEARAMVIARTETTRAATAFTEARSLSIGSDGYIWRTARDSDVRESHRKMEGKFVRWDNPPTLDGITGHAGAIPNCRCFPEPVIPDKFK